MKGDTEFHVEVSDNRDVTLFLPEFRNPTKFWSRASPETWVGVSCFVQTGTALLSAHYTSKPDYRSLWRAGRGSRSWGPWKPVLEWHLTNDFERTACSFFCWRQDGAALRSWAFRVKHICIFVLSLPLFTCLLRVTHFLSQNFSFLIRKMGRW